MLERLLARLLPASAHEGTARIEYSRRRFRAEGMVLKLQWMKVCFGMVRDSARLQDACQTSHVRHLKDVFMHSGSGSLCMWWSSGMERLE